MKNITKNCFVLEIILRSFWNHRLIVLGKRFEEEHLDLMKLPPLWILKDLDLLICKAQGYLSWSIKGSAFGNPKVKWHDLPYLGFGRKKKRKERSESYRTWVVSRWCRKWHDLSQLTKRLNRLMDFLYMISPLHFHPIHPFSLSTLPDNWTIHAPKLVVLIESQKWISFRIPNF